MLRIIDGLNRPCNHAQFDLASAMVLSGSDGDTFTVSAVELGNGHLEVSAKRDTVFKELDWTLDQVRDHMQMLADLQDDAEYQEDRKAKLLTIAANRAKTRVRRLCKAMGVTTLLTLTYRALEADLARVKADLKAFNRRMCVVWPAFRFVAGFEKQKRGAYHMHLATANIPAFFVRKNDKGIGHRVRSFDVIRSVWRSVTKDRGGNIDLSRRKHHGTSTAAKIASYISKYITKEFSEGEKGSNRFAAYGAAVVPASINLGRVDTALEAVEIAYSLAGGRVIFGQHFSRFGDWFYLHAENGAVELAR